MERMLKVQMVKLAGPGFNSTSPERRKRREEADYGSRVCAGEKIAERLQSRYGCGGGLKIASNQYNYEKHLYQL